MSSDVRLNGYFSPLDQRPAEGQLILAYLVDSDLSEYSATPYVKLTRFGGKRLMGPNVMRYQEKMFSEWGYKPLALWQPCPEIQ